MARASAVLAGHDDAAGRLPDYFGSVRCGGPIDHNVFFRRYLPTGESRGEVMCVHGISRNGRDFHRLALDLASSGFAVTCPDLPGHGGSDYLPSKHYTALRFALDCDQVLRQVTGASRLRALARDSALITPFRHQLLPTTALPGDKPIIWVGTSLGGLLGMGLASKVGSLIDALILNDVGPMIPGSFLDHVAAERPGVMPPTDDVQQVLEHVRHAHPGFGPMSEAQWIEFAAATIVERDDGRYHHALDPAILETLNAMPERHADGNVWMTDYWDRLRVPRYLLYGERSRVLTPEVYELMRDDCVQAAKIDDVGHAPSLLPGHQRETLVGWVEAIAERMTPSAPLGAHAHAGA